MRRNQPDLYDLVLCELRTHLLLEDVQHQLHTIKEQLQHMSDQQTQLDAAVTEINVDVQALTTGIANIQAELAAAQAANPGVDFTGLNAAVQSLDATAATVTPPPAG